MKLEIPAQRAGRAALAAAEIWLEPPGRYFLRDRGGDLLPEVVDLRDGEWYTLLLIGGSV